MVPDSEVPFLADVIEARQHDELVVEHVFEAVTDDEVSDIEEYSTGDDADTDSGLTAATANLDVPATFRDLGYIDPSKAKLRIPYQFAPPEVQPQNVAAAKPKPKPKAGARQLSMATFLAPKITMCFG